MSSILGSFGVFNTGVFVFDKFLCVASCLTLKQVCSTKKSRKLKSESKMGYIWVADQGDVHNKINLLRNQKRYNNSETTVRKLSARRIQI